MALDKNILPVLKEHFSYNDEEMKEFVKNSRNLEVLSKFNKEMKDKTIIIEIIESKGCNSQHKVGDKFYFDGAGNLLTKLSPKKICLYALARVESLVFAANELMYAGIDPNKMRFNRTNYFDVGLGCGGWGNIVMEIKVVDRLGSWNGKYSRCMDNESLWNLSV